MTLCAIVSAAVGTIVTNGPATLPATLPATAGIGLKTRHGAQLLDGRPPVAFVEIHAENYMGAGGPPHRWLSAIREHYPVSVHGVGLSLGGASPLDAEHLEALARVVDRCRPALVSEHLAWSQSDGVHLNDLLPIPYTPATLDHVAARIGRVQDRLRRPILVENPSAYIRYADSPIPEPEFLAELARRTGCGILLDVNNLFVCAGNVGLDPLAYLQALPAAAVGEYHLAGHHRRVLPDGSAIRIDDHGSRVAPEVWALYRAAVARIGARPTLIEWDTDVPPLDVLCDEAWRADAEAADALGFIAASGAASGAAEGGSHARPA